MNNPGSEGISRVVVHVYTVRFIHSIHLFGKSHDIWQSRHGALQAILSRFSLCGCSLALVRGICSAHLVVCYEFFTYISELYVLTFGGGDIVFGPVR